MHQISMKRSTHASLLNENKLRKMVMREQLFTPLHKYLMNILFYIHNLLVSSLPKGHQRNYFVVERKSGICLCSPPLNHCKRTRARRKGQEVCWIGKIIVALIVLLDLVVNRKGGENILTLDPLMCPQLHLKSKGFLTVYMSQWRGESHTCFEERVEAESPDTPKDYLLPIMQRMNTDSIYIVDDKCRERMKSLISWEQTMMNSFSQEAKTSSVVMPCKNWVHIN